MKKYIKRIIIVLVTIFIIIGIIPYLIPIDLYEQSSEKPFETSQYKNIEGIKIHYRTWIPNTKEVKGKILMIHGLGGSTFSWRNNIEDLRNKGYIVITADLPGFGYSDKRAGIDHSQKNRSRILWTLLEDLELSLPENSKKLDWTLVGHSMGGGTVVAMTIDKPDKTNKLILVSGAVFDNSPPLISSFFYYPPVKRAIDVAFGNYILNYERIESSLSSAYGRKPTKEEVENHLIPLKLKKVPSFIPDLLRTAKSESVENLENNKVPILYIAGENDTWIPKEDTMKFKEIIPRTKLITIENSAHCSMETNYDEFNKIVLSYINTD